MHSSPSPAAARAGRYAFPALILGNLVLAVGPWMVRLADVGPIASGFWRLAIAIPFLAAFALVQQRGRETPPIRLIGLVAIGGLFFASDLAAWHVGIGMTKLANASLFGNASSFILVVYGFVALHRLPRRGQGPPFACARGGGGPLVGARFGLNPQELPRGLFSPPPRPPP